MRILTIVLLCLLATGCELTEPTVPKSVVDAHSKAIAGAGMLYGQVMMAYTIGKRDSQEEEEVEIACRHLVAADEITKDMSYWPKEYVESFSGMAEFRAYCAKKVTEN